jgi:hypothetical protein
MRLGPEFIAGLAAGLSNLDDRVPADLKLIAATAPVGGAAGGKLKAFSQGMIFGNIVQHKLGFRVGGSGAGDSDTL